ncbi:MAG: hypothetical protein ACRD4U_01450 [Candidatus Acidiferrales bacterium]
MKHLSHDELVLFHYGELAERREADGHLVECAGCRAEYDTLKQTLGAAESVPVPERGEGYGREVWARLRPRLEEERRGFPWMELFRPRRWAAVAVIVLLVLAAFLAGQYWRQPAPQVAQPLSPQVRERILLVAVGDHLERSERILIEIVNAEDGSAADISSERAWAEELVAANRLYRQTAAREGEAGVASVLEDLERVLLEVANSSDELTPAERERLRKRIESGGILFKVRVLGTQVREREKETARETRAGRA